MDPTLDPLPPGEPASACAEWTEDREGLLTFPLGDRVLALKLPDLRGLGVVGRLRAVPRAPSCVMGLAEWRGRVVTVLDLAALLGERPGWGPPSLVCLARPNDHVALFLRAPVRVCGSESVKQEGPRAPEILDPPALIALAEAEVERLRGRSPTRRAALAGARNA